MKQETLDKLVGHLCELGGPTEALSIGWVRLANQHEGLSDDEAVYAAFWCYSGRPEYARFPTSMHAIIETR